MVTMARSRGAVRAASSFRGLTPHRRAAPSLAGRASHKRRPRQVTVMGLFGLGLPEVAVIAGVAVLLFGPSKIPELGKSLGKTVRGLQDASQEFKEELDKELAKGPEDEEGSDEVEKSGEE